MFDSGALSVAVATVAASMIAYVLLFIRRNVAEEGRKRYPPSAPVLPLLVAVLRGGMGVMPDYFRRCAEKLGPVLSCNLGGRLIVILNDKEALTEAYVKQSDIFSDRFEFWTETNVANYDLKGIVFAKYTQTLKKNRKISLTILKEFGYGVSSVSETRILHEVESLFDEIMKSNGSPMDPKYMTDRAISNVVLNILFGRQFMSVEKNHKRLIDGVHEFCDNLEPALNMAPLLRFLPSFKKKIEVVFRSNRDMMRVIGEGIECNKADATEPTFVRRYLEIEGPAYDHQELLYILRDLVLAATETVSSVVLWAFVELANHPDVQSRLQREIDDAVHENRFPSLKDKPRLPYTEVVILELLRRRTVVPFPIPRVSCKDTQLLGCFIPKESLIITNIYSPHMSELTWKDPEKFDPERFFDKDNNCTGGERIQPFGCGKRSCLGEILAQQEMFLFLTSLVQRFDIRPPEGQDSISVTEISAVTMHPSDFKVRLIPRRRS